MFYRDIESNGPSRASPGTLECLILTLNKKIPHALGIEYRNRSTSSFRWSISLSNSIPSVTEKQLDLLLLCTGFLFVCCPWFFLLSGKTHERFALKRMLPAHGRMASLLLINTKLRTYVDPAHLNEAFEGNTPNTKIGSNCERNKGNDVASCF